MRSIFATIVCGIGLTVTVHDMQPSRCSTAPKPSC